MDILKKVDLRSILADTTIVQKLIDINYGRQ